MGCHICTRTGIRTCDPDEADIKCLVCGFCQKEDERAAREAAADERKKHTS